MPRRLKIEPPKNPHLRINRTKHLEIEDETAHLWAVSYADFLMVLLSFFVIFFSVNDNRKIELIRKISSVGSEGQILNNTSGKNSSPNELTHSLAKKNNLFASLSSKYKNVSIDQESDSILIQFPEHAFDLNAITLGGKVKSELIGVLDDLFELRDSLDLTFVGYTDNSPIFSKKNKLINDNFDLSALRASSTLKIALARGWPRDQLFVHASAATVRNSRTFSLQIKLKGESRL